MIRKHKKVSTRNDKINAESSFRPFTASPKIYLHAAAALHGEMSSHDLNHIRFSLYDGLRPIWKREGLRFLQAEENKNFRNKNRVAIIVLKYAQYSYKIYLH